MTEEKQINWKEELDKIKKYLPQKQLDALEKLIIDLYKLAKESKGKVSVDYQKVYQLCVDLLKKDKEEK